MLSVQPKCIFRHYSIISVYAFKYRSGQNYLNYGILQNCRFFKAYMVNFSNNQAFILVHSVLFHSKMNSQTPLILLYKSKLNSLISHED